MAEPKTQAVNLIRLKDAIERYSLSRSTFDRLAHSGAITKYPAGRVTFVDSHQIDAWIMGQRQSA
ncbi:DUF6462 family protein [Ruegeria sp. HKCCSA071]|uniref:helix-turn-helix transcriptional regulator n=1 Tax=Ruegeria sp. HKCCSA071 TaxID=2794834 RepID=UPI001AE7F6A0|nr:DUF6462 family protein [Ruegeria sp. HKCCSA071]